ncbi:MAG: polyphosphate polymerase domain-containing protein [Lachnospiraceae bacterium]|nr:polyphosphate polymerase domain-containing protein [Lachnospiraceae bacterium]
MQPQDTFKRYEKKYLLNAEKMQKLLPIIEEHMQLDEYGKHTICNIYLDTENFALIRESIEKPVYKEKLRLRSYGVPTDSDTVFLELKKKFDGIVYKRRIAMPLKQAMDYLYEGKELEQKGQIPKELDYAIQKYKVHPAVYLSYERRAYYGKEQADLRITFDENILCREEKLDLREGSFGTPLLEESESIMEIKIPGTMPLWLSKALSENEIFPFSYSKYGTYYKKYIIPQMLYNTKTNTALWYKNYRRVLC